jgi:hypothetical protein
VNVLFVLLPADRSPDELAAPSPVSLVRYPRADNPAHLHSLVRAAANRHATTAWRGLAAAVLGGALLGATVNGILTAGFGMLGGLLEIGVPLGFGVGAFLGGFTAAMTGTAQPRDELRPLLQQATPGSTLLQWSCPEPSPLRALATAAERAGLPHRLCLA